MKKLKAILSIALMGMLIFSTLGFSVSRHYCMGMLVEESFYHFGNESCGMDSQDDCWKGDQSLGMSCCEDENLFISGIEILRLAEKKEIFVPDLTADLHSEGIYRFAKDISLNEPLSSPSPPVLKPSGRQILVSVQRFTI